MNKYLTINNLKVWVEIKPGGPQTILFLHQSSGSAKIWNGQWEAPALQNYTLIRIEFPGHGLSDRSSSPKEHYNLHYMGGIIQKVVEELSIECYITVAISLSTNFIGEIAPLLKNCRGFFLAGASIIGTGISLGDILMPFEYGDVLFSSDPPAERLTQYIRGLIHNDNDHITQLLVQDFHNADPEFRRHMGSCIAEGNWVDELAQLIEEGKPVALIYGAEEKIIHPFYLNNHLLTKWSDSIHIIQHAGHLCNLDQPEAFNNLLRAFAGDVFL